MAAHALPAAVTVEHAMLGLSVLQLLSVLASKVADRTEARPLREGV